MNACQLVTVPPTPTQNEAAPPEPQETPNEADALVDDWILRQDKLPLLLSVSLYSSPIQSMGGFELKHHSPRIGVWVNEQTRTVVIGLRGTSFGKQDFKKDLWDDRVLAGLAGGDVCNLTLVNEATPYVQQSQGYHIIAAGHSLGGAAALCLGEKFPQIQRIISFNGGAPPTNPRRTGPGPERAVHYHVEGDLISSHMFPEAAQVIRIRKKNKNSWGTVYPHSSDRMFRDDDPWVYITANDEENSYIRAGGLIPIKRLFVCNTPIPGSSEGCFFRHF